MLMQSIQLTEKELYTVCFLFHLFKKHYKYVTQPKQLI